MRFVFADTSHYLALFGPRDRHHLAAVTWSRQTDLSVVTSEFVLLELGNALARGNDRGLFVDLDRALRADAGIEIVPVSANLYRLGVELFARRQDKTWSLVDCTSFVIMNHRGVTEALTADQHFLQAGFRALLLEPPPAG